jgi:hypothetical protein
MARHAHVILNVTVKDKDVAAFVTYPYNFQVFRVHAAWQN